MCERSNGIDSLCGKFQDIEFHNEAYTAKEAPSSSGFSFRHRNFEGTSVDQGVNEKIEWAIKNGDVDELRKIFSSLGNVNYLTQNLSRPAVVIAADYGQNNVIKFLLNEHLNVNVLDGYGISPLLAAIWEGHAATVNVLLKHGADPHAFKSPAGLTYLDEAADKKDILEIIQQYWQEGSGRTYS